MTAACIAGRVPLPVRRVRRTPVCFTMALTVWLAGCTPTGGGADTALEAHVDALVAPLVVAHEFSGAVVLTRRGKIVYERGFGMANHAAGLPFTSRTPSDGASLAKTFTASSIWWLTAEGRIELDAPVTRYVAEYPHTGTTVRQLIGHSNGLPADYAWFDAHFAATEPRTTPLMLALVAQHQPSPAFTPGTRFEYSSIGFDVAALLLERVTGKRYEDVLQARFFSPLGMRESFVRPARLAEWTGPRTLGYRWQDSTWVTVDVFDMEAFRGGSNIYFSARDLSRWASAHSAGTALPDGVWQAGGQRTSVGGKHTGLTGLNWYCDDARTRCFYTGDLNAFFSFVYWDRTRDHSVVYVSNSSLPAWRRAWLSRELIASLTNLRAVTPDETSFQRFTRDSIASVAGVYQAHSIGTITVVLTARSLRMRIADGLEYDLFQVSPDVLYAPGLDYWLAFSGGARPSTLHVRSVFFDAVLQRKR